MASKLLQNPVYRAWAYMKNRCNNPHNNRYYRYGWSIEEALGMEGRIG